MKIGYFQWNPEFGNPEKNRELMADRLKAAEADIIVLPELSTSGYLFSNREEVENLSETIPGPSTDMFSALAQKTGTNFIFGIPEKSAEGIYNSAVLVGSEGVKGVYRKVHLFFHEKEYFLQGDSFPLFEIGGVKIGILVCFDHMFAEAARTLALQGAQVICHPSNLVLPEYGQLTTRVRALENRVYWVLANRTGTETRGDKHLTYTGESQIVAPGGNIIHRGTPGEEELFITTIDPKEALNKNITELNNLFADRRSSLYS